MEVVSVNEILEQVIKNNNNLKYIHCRLVVNYNNSLVLQIYYNPIKVLSNEGIVNILLALNQYNIKVNEVHIFKITSNILNLINDIKNEEYTKLNLELLHCLDYKSI